MKPRTLVIGIGNPSRGDDALGPLLVEMVSAQQPQDVDFLVDYQLQVEHVLDVADRERVIFVDASVACADPFEFVEIEAGNDMGYFSTHGVTPASLLSAYQKYWNAGAPRAFVLAVKAVEFQLGAGLSMSARSNLQAAYKKMMLELSVQPPIGTMKKY